MGNWIVLGVGIATLFFLYFLYVDLVKKKNRVFEALSSIDVQLNKRCDLIPNILTIAKKFMEHEQELLTEVTKLRAAASGSYDPSDSQAVKEHLKTIDQLGGSLGRIMVAVEAYPDLKSDATMIQAQRTYNEVEEQIAAARRFYNSAVGDLNNAVEIFPGSLVAPLANAKSMPFYEADKKSKEPVSAGDFLN